MSNVGRPTVQSPTSEPSDLNVTLFVVIVVTVIKLVGSFRPGGKTITISEERLDTLGAREECPGHTAKDQKMPCTQIPHEILCE